MSEDLKKRILSYEGRETGRKFLPGVPVVARLDGKRFSKFTKQMEKPWDHRFTETMIETTRRLVEETHALIGYTQSDEISLVYMAEGPKSELWLGGRVQKMTSILASMATAFFNDTLRHRMKASPPAFFDCRVFQVPSKQEAVNTLMWREFDAARNSISMLAQHHFSHKRLHGKSTSDMQDMLLLEKDTNWNDVSDVWKRGVYLQRKTTTEPMTEEILANIPEHVRHTIPAEVTRSSVVRLELPRLTQISNRVEMVFDGADPETDITADLKIS